MRFRTKLKRAIERRVQAEIAYAWKGAQADEERERIEREAVLARKRLEQALDEMDIHFQRAMATT